MVVSNELNLVLFLMSMGLLVASSFLSRRAFLFLCGFFIPLWTPRLNVGVNVFLYQAIPLVTMVLLPLTRNRPRGVMKNDPLRSFLIYAVVLSAIWFALELLVLDRIRFMRKIGLGPAQSDFRMPVALVSFLLQCAAFYVIPLRARTRGEVYAGLKGFVASVVVSFGVGLIMFAVTGVGYVREAETVWNIEGVTVGRIGGISGEPRHLGAYLVISLALVLPLLFKARAKTREDTWLRTPHLYFVGMLIALFATFSTSAWVGFGALLLGFGIYVRRLGSVVGFVIAGAFITLVLWQSPFFRAVIEIRLVDRLVTEETQDIDKQKDYIVLAIFEDKPYVTPVGFGLGGLDLEAVEYVLTDARFSVHSEYTRTPTPSSTGPRLLGELGLAGFLLLTLFTVNLSKTLRSRGHPRLALTVVIAYVGALPATSAAISAFLFVCGGAWALVRGEPSPANAPKQVSNT